MIKIRRTSARSVLGALSLFLVAVVACGGLEAGRSTSVEPTTTTTSPDNLGGDRLSVQVPGEDYGQGSSRMTGTLGLAANGCWTIDLGDGPRMVIFPLGFDKPFEDGSVLTSPRGDRYAGGDAVDGDGLIVNAASLPGGRDGFWNSYLGFCGGERPEVVVLNTMREAFEPGELTDSQLRELLETADLSVSWGCGFGFQVSTWDQRVALRLFPFDMEQTAPPQRLPDPAWEANALIGKHLQVDNCDDVVEGWEPVPQVAAVWPVTGGFLSFDLPDESGCGVADSVTAMLGGIVVTTPSGDVELGDLQVVNEAFGYFAG